MLPVVYSPLRGAADQATDTMPEDTGGSWLLLPVIPR